MALGLVGSFAATAAAQDSGALIDALVRKGVLKDQEAEQIRSQLSRDFAANAPAGKLNLSSSVKELKLSGDVRVRGQWDNQQVNNPANNVNATGGTTAPLVANSHDSQRVRYRLRLRVNADYKVSDDFFAGFGLQTTQNNDSGNQTMAGGTNGDYFQNYPVFVSKAFLGWTPVPGVTLIGGKQANPFYTTDLVWDADINPTGFTERVDLHKFLGLGGLELSLVAGQLVVSDNAEGANYSANTRNQSRDGFIYQTQLIAAAEVAEGVKVTIAPGYYCTNNGYAPNNGGGEANWTSAGNGTAAGSAAGNANNVAGARTLSALSVFLLPGDVSTTIAGLKTKFLWDAAYNSDGFKRNSLYTNRSTVAGGAILNNATDRRAWMAGVQVGENKKKGDWSLSANYRQVGASAVDPNINDSDWALSYTNMQGPKVGFQYNLGDATTFGATYYYADNMRKDLGVLGNTTMQAGPASTANSVQVLQLDVQVKF